MNEQELSRNEVPSLESLQEVRLTALLHDLVNEQGRMQAARTLGVNYKTLAGAVESGNLTRRLYDALERLLLSRNIEAFADVGERVMKLEGRIEALEESARRVPAEVGEAVERELERRREEFGAVGRARERPVGATTRPRGGTTIQPVVANRREPPIEPFRKMNRSAVTLESEPVDAQDYGRAWPLVDEWRKLRGRHPDQGKGLSWLVDEERLRELEIELIGEHKLTLAPDTDPWDNFGRRTQVRWRTQTLNRVRRVRARAQIRRWLRRFLTLGLWRN